MHIKDSFNRENNVVTSSNLDKFVSFVISKQISMGKYYMFGKVEL